MGDEESTLAAEVVANTGGDCETLLPPPLPLLLFGEANGDENAVVAALEAVFELDRRLLFEVDDESTARRFESCLGGC